MEVVDCTVVLLGAVVVESVVEAPERHPEGEVVQPVLVARQPGVELGVHEVTALDELQRRARRHRLGLRVLGGEGPLAVEAPADLEVAVLVEVEGVRAQRGEQEGDDRENESVSLPLRTTMIRHVAQPPFSRSLQAERSDSAVRYSESPFAWNHPPRG